MTVICEICHKIGEMPDPWSEDADIIEKLAYRMSTVLCHECIRKYLAKESDGNGKR